MSASVSLDTDPFVSEEKLSLHELSLLNTYLDELVKEEGLSLSAEIILRRIAVPVSKLAGSVKALFASREHPARKTIDTTVKIAKLSGPSFVPGEALYQTVIESITILRAKRFNGLVTLQRVQEDLESVLRLATIKKTKNRTQDFGETGSISSAKIVAALMIVAHVRRFDVDDKLLYFALTEWFELAVVTVLQCGSESRELKELDRMTFIFLYLASGRSGAKHGSFLAMLLPKLDELIGKLDPVCMGHAANFDALRRHLGAFIQIG